MATGTFGQSRASNPFALQPSGAKNSFSANDGFMAAGKAGGGGMFGGQNLAGSGLGGGFAGGKSSATQMRDPYAGNALLYDPHKKFDTGPSTGMSFDQFRATGNGGSNIGALGPVRQHDQLSGGFRPPTMPQMQPQKFGGGTSQPFGAPQPQGPGAPPSGLNPPSGIFSASTQPNAGIRPASQGPPIAPIGSPSQAPPPGMAYSQSPQQSPPGTPALPGQSGPPPTSAGPVGGSGGMYDIRTSINPTGIFSPEQTQRSINQDAERFFTQADERSLLPGAGRQGMSTGAGTRAMIAPQQGALEAQVMGSQAFRPIQDNLTNLQHLLQGQQAQGQEGLGLADVLRRAQASQDLQQNAFMGPLISALMGMM